MIFYETAEPWNSKHHNRIVDNCDNPDGCYQVQDVTTKLENYKQKTQEILHLQGKWLEI